MYSTSELGREVLGSDVHGGQILLNRKVCKAPDAIFTFDEEPAGGFDCFQELHAWRSGTDRSEGPLNHIRSFTSRDFADAAAHHVVREGLKDALLLVRAEIKVKSPSLAPAAEKDRADVVIELHAAARQRTTVAVNSGYHGQQERIGREIAKIAGLAQFAE